MIVLFDRLRDMACIDTKEFWSWPDAPPVYPEDTLDARSKGVPGNCEPYGDTWKHPVNKERDKDYHISRIIYFMDHPNEICDIEVDTPCFDGFILPGCVIIDGYHRMAAATVLGLQTVSINYGGRSDVKDYICGKTDVRPEEIL